MSIEYILPNNPDDRILKKASDCLKNGGLVCFPTDSSWVVTCDPFSKTGVDKLYKFKGENKSKHFSVLCHNISIASEIAVINDSSFRLLRNKIPCNFTFIFEATKKMIKAVKASKTDHEVGIRFSPCIFTGKFLEFFDGPLLSTNITHELLSLDGAIDIYSYQVEEVLGNKLDFILDPGEYEFVGPSTIIDLSMEGEASLVREGSGDPSDFRL